MAPEAILQLDGMEIRTSDPLCVRTLWGLMASAVSPSDALFLEGLPEPADDVERP
jgi:hypothetical protein